MMDRLDEIRARCETATPGPWFNFGDWLIHTETDVEHNGIPHEKTIGSVKVQNASFIAHAREDIPYLLEQINISTARAEKAAAERDTYRAALQLLELVISGEREGSKEREHSVGVVIAVNRARELMKGE